MIEKSLKAASHGPHDISGGEPGLSSDTQEGCGREGQEDKDREGQEAQGQDLTLLFLTQHPPSALLRVRVPENVLLPALFYRQTDAPFPHLGDQSVAVQ